MLRASIIALLALASAAHAEKCPLSSEKPMVEVQLFFGRDIEGRGPVTNNEWADFAATVLTRQFPDGFTVSDGEGQWRDPVSKAVVHEQSKIVTVAAPHSPALMRKLTDVMSTYRTRFHQQSVGIVTRSVCAAF